MRTASVGRSRGGTGRSCTNNRDSTIASRGTQNVTPTAKKNQDTSG